MDQTDKSSNGTPACLFPPLDLDLPEEDEETFGESVEAEEEGAGTGESESTCLLSMSSEPKADAYSAEVDVDREMPPKRSRLESPSLGQVLVLSDIGDLHGESDVDVLEAGVCQIGVICAENQLSGIDTVSEAELEGCGAVENGEIRTPLLSADTSDSLDKKASQTISSSSPKRSPLTANRISSHSPPKSSPVCDSSPVSDRSPVHDRPALPNKIPVNDESSTHDKTEQSQVPSHESRSHFNGSNNISPNPLPSSTARNEHAELRPRPKSPPHPSPQKSTAENHSPGNVSLTISAAGGGDLSDNGTVSSGSQPQEPYSFHVDYSRLARDQDTWDQKLTDTAGVLLRNMVCEPQRGVSEKQLKRLLRSGTCHPGAPFRSKAWQWLCTYRHQKLQSPGFYNSSINDICPDNGEEVFQQPAWPQAPSSDPNIHSSHYLTPRGKSSANRIVCFIQQTSPDISYGPTFLAMADLFLHYMDEEDCYSLIETLHKSRVFEYLIQTRKLFDVSKLVLRDLLKKYCKRDFSDLSKSCNIDSVFNQWLQWIYSDLPFNYVVAVTDCYLNEGIKVLYRVAMAIVILFNKTYQLKRIRMTQVESKISQFCQGPPFTPALLLKTAFKIRNFTRGKIHRLTQLHMVTVSDAVKTTSIYHVPSHISMASGTASVALPPATVAMFKKAGSNIITPEQFYQIWDWLPQRQKIMRPRLLFSSEQHGTSLITLYKKLDEDMYPHKETIFVIKALSGEVFGAYCASHWLERLLKENLDGRFFGLGQTFLFSLEPQRAKYPWVGTAKEDGVPVNQHDIPMSASMFQSGDNHNLLIGGGGPGNGIYLDSTFRFCRSATCDTFNNPPLVKNEDFEASAIEVFGFAED